MRVAFSILTKLEAAVSIALLLSACAAATRPAEPPRGAPHRVPDGAIALRQNEMPTDIALGHTLSHALDHRFTGDLERDASGRPVFRVLAISGGGSRGAYGAGVLEGWTETGTRPDFEVVTGISTGALMATFAFLGPEYDDCPSMFVNKGWAQRHPEGYRRLLDAVALTRSELSKPL